MPSGEALATRPPTITHTLVSKVLLNTHADAALVPGLSTAGPPQTSANRPLTQWASPRHSPPGIHPGNVTSHPGPSHRAIPCCFIFSAGIKRHLPELWGPLWAVCAGRRLHGASFSFTQGSCLPQRQPLVEALPCVGRSQSPPHTQSPGGGFWAGRGNATADPTRANPHQDIRCDTEPSKSASYVYSRPESCLTGRAKPARLVSAASVRTTRGTYKRSHPHHRPAHMPTTHMHTHTTHVHTYTPTTHVHVHTHTTHVHAHTYHTRACTDTPLQPFSPEPSHAGSKTPP